MIYLRKLIKAVVILTLIIALGMVIQPDYMLVMPGSTEGLGQLIELEGESRSEDGEFYMVTVSQRQANIWGLMYGAFHPVIDIRSFSESIPPGLSQEEYSELLRSWMQDSQNLAQVIALRKTGYDVPIASDGVEVVELIEESPAEGLLEPGDIIKEVDGEEVNLAEDVVHAIQQKEIGEPVTLLISRDESLEEKALTTAYNPEQPDQAALRIYVRTLNWQPLLPFSISIETGPVVGPSAGMMFVLEIIDRMVPENLTRGYKIAGTGTITLDEKVGSIGGVKQKVVAAENAGAEYFLVPEENYQEALQASREIQVVKVGDLDEVIEFLETLDLQAEAECFQGAFPLDGAVSSAIGSLLPVA